MMDPSNTLMNKKTETQTLVPKTPPKKLVLNLRLLPAQRNIKQDFMVQGNKR